MGVCVLGTVTRDEMGGLSIMVDTLRGVSVLDRLFSKCLSVAGTVLTECNARVDEGWGCTLACAGRMLSITLDAVELQSDTAALSSNKSFNMYSPPRLVCNSTLRPTSIESSRTSRRTPRKIEDIASSIASLRVEAWTWMDRAPSLRLDEHSSHHVLGCCV